MSNISIAPFATTNAAGLFNVNSAGFTQGDAQDDPAVKFKLAGGVLLASASAPMWGGIPITELIPAAVTTPGSDVLGPTVQLATALANVTGICVFNQAFHGVTSPQSPVPLYAPGSSVNFYRTGSGARIPLRLNPALVSIDGSIISTQLSWDFTNQWLTTYDGTNAFPVKVLKVSATGNKTVSYNSGTGLATYLTTEVVALCLL